MKYKIIAKYFKDLKFNIPNPKTFFELAKDISNYKIKIDIKSNQYKEKIVEVETSLELKSVTENSDNIRTQITHSAIIELDGDVTKKEELKEIILVKVPTEVYSEIRETFIFLFEKSGFKEIKIDKNVDFKKLYKERNFQ